MVEKFNALNNFIKIKYKSLNLTTVTFHELRPCLFIIAQQIGQHWDFY